MKLSNLKKIKPKNIKIDNADSDYADYLCSLPEEKTEKQVWGALGTVAAAIIIVVAVSLWAIIGRGVRTGPPEVKTPASESENTKITDQMQQQFNIMYQKSRLFALPIFKRDEKPSQKAFSDYVYYLESNAKSDWIITASELNELYLKTFGVKSDFTTGINYSGPYSVNVSLGEVKLLSFVHKNLKDGTPVITITYGEPDVSVTTLSYVPISDFEPDYFIEHTSLNTVFIKKTENPFEESVYKVSGDQADELLDIVRNAIKTKDSDVCYCAPTHKIVFNNIEYKVVMGSNKGMSHIVFTSGLDGTTNHKLKEAEITRLEEVFKNVITDKNFVETKETEYIPTATEVTVIVPDIATEYKTGTYTIVGDDAKKLVTSLESKFYVGFNGLQATGMIELKINERTYYIYVGDDKVHVENTCGSIKLDLNDEIMKIIKKYIESPEVIHYPNQTFNKKEQN